jgi:flagellar hook protein FlgE
MQTTSRTLDLALSGNGFFAVGSFKEGFNLARISADNQIPGAVENTIELNYTRAGNFYLDDQGYIVTADGMYVIGAAGDKNPVTGEFGGSPVNNAGLIQIPLTAQSFSISQDGTVSFVNEAGDLNVAGQIRLANFANDGGLEKVGGNLYRETTNAGTLVGNPDEGLRLNDLSIAGENGTSTMVSGALEMSNVDLTEEFTDMIVAQRGFQSNTKIITTSDEVLQEIMGLKR